MGTDPLTIAARLELAQVGLGPRPPPRLHQPLPGQLEFDLAHRGPRHGRHRPRSLELGDTETRIDFWDVRVINNSATSDGGAIYVSGKTRLNYNNVAFSGNASGNRGGAMYLTNSGIFGTMYHVSLYDNTAVGEGDGFYVTHVTTANLVNSVLWGNGNSDDFFGADNVNISYTCSQEFLSIDPGNQLMFVSPFDIGPNGELFLNQVPQNLCVDGASDNAANTSYDNWGAPTAWQMMTTASDSMLDSPPADMGVHYLP